MSKKMIFIGIIGVLTLSFLIFPTLTYADQYYLQYSGNSFQPWKNTMAYEKSHDGHIFHFTSGTGYYYCPVNFNIPDGSTYFIKSIGMRFYDNLTDGDVYIELKRINLYTGAVHTVANWSSGIPDASSNDQTACQGTISGYKLVDTKKFAYYLYVFLWKEGSANPGSDLPPIIVQSPELESQVLNLPPDLTRSHSPDALISKG
jgi:hypothetical protein